MICNLLHFNYGTCIYLYIITFYHVIFLIIFTPLQFFFYYFFSSYSFSHQRSAITINILNASHYDYIQHVTD